MRSITCLVIISFFSICSMHAQYVSAASNQSRLQKRMPQETFSQETLSQVIGVGKTLDSYTGHVMHSLQFWHEDEGGSVLNKQTITSFMQTARIHDELQYELSLLLLSGFEIAEKYKYDAVVRSKHAHELVNDSLRRFVSTDPVRQSECRTFLTAYQQFLVNGEIVPKQIPFYKTSLGKCGIIAGSLCAGSALLKLTTDHWDGGMVKKVNDDVLKVIKGKLEDLLATDEGCEKIVALASSVKSSHDPHELKKIISNLDNKTLARLSKAYIKSSSGLLWEKTRDRSNKFLKKFKREKT